MGYCRANFGKKFLKINIDIESCYFNLGPSIILSKNKAGRNQKAVPLVIKS